MKRHRNSNNLDGHTFHHGKTNRFSKRQRYNQHKLAVAVLHNNNNRRFNEEHLHKLSLDQI